VKQQAEDLVRDLEGIVEEWRGMAAGTWSEEEKGQIEWYVLLFFFFLYVCCVCWGRKGWG
jgi:hypothetical protein